MIYSEIETYVSVSLKVKLFLIGEFNDETISFYDKCLDVNIYYFFKINLSCTWKRRGWREKTISLPLIMSAGISKSFLDVEIQVV